MPGTKIFLGPKKAVWGFFRLLLRSVICQKVTKKIYQNIILAKNFAQAKIWIQNLATWATFPWVLLHKNFKKSLFLQELTQELKIKPGTNPGTKKSEELTQELNTISGTKSSSSGTKLRTLNLSKVWSLNNAYSASTSLILWNQE